jgi:3-methylfumaryl-CoA hydratase
MHLNASRGGASLLPMIDPAQWLGRREETQDVCALPLVRRLAALLDQDPARLRTGDALPEGWHMILFTPETRQSALGSDGHAGGGDFLPPPPLPRRMLGGRRTRFAAPIRIGDEMKRVSEVTGFEEKSGRSGKLVIVTLRHSIGPVDGDAAVIEEQDIIYREPASPAAKAEGAKAEGAAAEEPRAEPVATRDFRPDPVLLFRYSAVTFNGHRIHYDAPYATGTEGYPGLIVNGGLTALLALELGKQAMGRAPVAMQVRNRRPLICDRPARLCAAPAEAGFALWAEDDKGRVALEASIK